MDPPVEEKPAADLRDYLAEERTFLAWIRTGLTLMGFGFVVAQLWPVSRKNANHSRRHSRAIPRALSLARNHIYRRRCRRESLVDKAPSAPR